MTEDIEKKSGLVEMLKMGNDALNRYKNLIGIGVFLMFIAFSFIFITSIQKQEKIAEKCGFTDGKLKCICTQQAWNEKMEINYSDSDLKLPITNKSIDLNSSNSSISTYG